MPICDACWAEMPFQSGPVCPRCGDTLYAPAVQADSALCRTCRLAPPPFVRAVAYGVYQGRMRDAIHALKYDRLHPASRRLGQMLARAIVQLRAEAPTEMLVVPVPLHHSKRAQRGFNQARLLAVEALRSLRQSHPQWHLTLAGRILLRHRVTESQAGLSPRQRRLNLRGAFAVSDPQAVAGRHVLLIDDILTTGATARSAARALLRAGAEQVWVATLARARRNDWAAGAEPGLLCPGNIHGRSPLPDGPTPATKTCRREPRGRVNLSAAASGHTVLASAVAGQKEISSLGTHAVTGTRHDLFIDSLHGQPSS